MMRNILHFALALSLIAPGLIQAQSTAQVTALRVGHLVDPENATVTANQIILIQDGKFTAIGANLALPADANVVDMSQYYVSPGLVDAHNHLALTYKEEPEHNSYYLTSVLDSTALRASRRCPTALR